MTKPWKTFVMVVAAATGCGGDDAGLPDAGSDASVMPSLCEAAGAPFATEWTIGSSLALFASVDEARGQVYEGRVEYDPEAPTPVSIEAHDLETGALRWQTTVGMGQGYVTDVAVFGSGRVGIAYVGGVLGAPTCDIAIVEPNGTLVATWTAATRACSVLAEDGDGNVVISAPGYQLGILGDQGNVLRSVSIQSGNCHDVNAIVGDGDRWWIGGSAGCGGSTVPWIAAVDPTTGTVLAEVTTTEDGWSVSALAVDGDRVGASVFDTITLTGVVREYTRTLLQVGEIPTLGAASGVAFVDGGIVCALQDGPTVWSGDVDGEVTCYGPDATPVLEVQANDVVPLPEGALVLSRSRISRYVRCPADPGTPDAQPGDTTAPATGSGPTFSAVTGWGATVSWSAATDDVTATTDLRYKVVRASSTSAIDTIAEVDAISAGPDLLLNYTAGALTIATFLQPLTTYAFAVVVADAAGNQALYEPTTVTTPDGLPPTRGAYIDFTNVTGTSVTVTWGAATDDVTPVSALEYKAVRRTTPFGVDTLAEVAAITTAGAGLLLDFTPNTTSVAATGLTPTATYHFAVVVRDAAGNQTLYYPTQLTTPEVVPPTVGSALGVLNVTATSAQLRWGAATDNVTAPLGLQYKVVRAATIAELDTIAEADAITSGPGLVLGFTTATTATTATALAPSTAYAFTVIVRDAAGNEALYTPVAITTSSVDDPTIAITSPVATVTFRTTASAIALGGSASDDVGVVSVGWMNDANATSGSASGTIAWSIAAVPLVLGTNAIHVTATDGDGNTGVATILVTRRRKVVEVAAGGGHTCALLDDGAVKCWGYNAEGELGLGDVANRGDAAGEMGDALPAVALGTGRSAVHLAAGSTHSCALLDNGGVKCWGENSRGELGLGDTARRGDGPGEMGDALPEVALGTGRTAVAIAAASTSAHTCALLDDGSVKCWGENGAGQLGLGDVARRGDGVGEMGDALPAVALGTGRTAIAIAVGGGYTCALLDDGDAKCWGYNSAGQLGVGDIASRGDGAGEMGDALPVVDLGTGRTVISLAAGGAHVCARLDDASVKCWGLNLYGQLGLGDVAHRGDGPGEVGDALPAISLGAGRTALGLAGGLYHSCARLDDGSLKCWGYNVIGQLGVGDLLDRGDAAGEMGDALPAINLGAGRTTLAVTAGYYHTCALLDDGTVKCWGYNSIGQLGLGDTVPHGYVASGMGDGLPAVDL